MINFVHVSHASTILQFTYWMNEKLNNSLQRIEIPCNSILLKILYKSLILKSFPSYNRNVSSSRTKMHWIKIFAEIFLRVFYFSFNHFTKSPDFLHTTDVFLQHWEHIHMSTKVPWNILWILFAHSAFCELKLNWICTTWQILSLNKNSLFVCKFVIPSKNISEKHKISDEKLKLFLLRLLWLVTELFGNVLEYVILYHVKNKSKHSWIWNNCRKIEGLMTARGVIRRLFGDWIFYFIWDQSALNWFFLLFHFFHTILSGIR